MAGLTRLRMMLAFSSTVVLGTWAPRAAAQNPPGRLPDSTYQRLIGCGTHGPALQRREATREVRQALGNVSSCPEGPEVLANLWASVTGATDAAYVGTLVNVSSIRHRRVAVGMLRALSDRGVPTAVRMGVLGGFLQQLTGKYGSSIKIATASRQVLIDSLGRPIGYGDSTRKAFFATGSHTFVPAQIDAALRAEILTTIARIAADPSEMEDLRIAARDVHAELLKYSQ